jgi:hypothetical protein
MDDADVPDSPVDRFLKNLDSKTEATIQNTKGLVVEEIAQKKPKNSQDTTEKPFQIFKHAIYYDQKLLTKHLQARNSKLMTHILTNADEDYLCDLFLFENSRHLVDSNKTMCTMTSILLLAAVLLLTYKTPGFSIVLLGVLAVILTQKFILRLLLDYLIDKTVVDYMANTENLIKLLKQIDLINLNQNYYFKKHQTFDLNLGFRRNVFVCLNSFCLHVQDFNRDWNTIAKSERMPVLESDVDQQQLRILTDDFSLKSIKALGRFNFLKISESFKLIFSSLIVCDNLSIAWRTFSLFLFFSNENSKMSKLLNSVKLNDAANVEKNSSSKAMKSTSLSLYLRNALLNCYKYEEDPLKHADMLDLIAHDLDFCILSLKKLNVNKGNYDAPCQSMTSSLSVVASEQSENQHVEVIAHDQVVSENEDFIFEAFSNQLRNEPQNFGKSDEFADSDDGERDLINRSLLNELKTVLVNKQNEWSERERMAKRVGDKDVAELASYDRIETDQLLDVNILKYKSNLRRRRKTQVPLENTDDLFSKNIFLNENLFLAQIINKKNELFSISNQSSEIVYE